MICQKLSTILGMQCHPLNEEGTIAQIDSTFKFVDGDILPIYIEYVAGQIRFFDAGEVMLHFSSRGISFNKTIKANFLKKAAEESGASVNNDWEIEAWAPLEKSSQAFEKYISTLFALVKWEGKQIGIHTDIDLLINEVALCFKAAYPKEIHAKSQEFTGISGHKYKFDFIHGSKAVLVVTTHHASVSSALKKLVDLNQVSRNNDFSPLIVIDDRLDKEAANNESKVLTAVADVMPFTTLEKKSFLVHTQQ